MKVRALAVVASAALAFSVFAPSADAGTPQENCLFGMINQQRNQTSGQTQRHRRRHHRPRPPAPSPVPSPGPSPSPGPNPSPGPSSCPTPAVGPRTLKESAVILTEVRQHSQDMAAQNNLSHFGFDDRVAHIKAADSGTGTFFCENVAYVQGTPDDQAPAALFQLWMNSTPHRTCMLDQQGYQTQSAAVGLFKSGTTWWATFITAVDTTP